MGDFATLIETAVWPQASSGSLYIRFPFEHDTNNVFTILTLRMKYDDGFVAYLNGVKVAERNAPASPNWRSYCDGRASE